MPRNEFKFGKYSCPVGKAVVWSALSGDWGPVWVVVVQSDGIPAAPEGFTSALEASIERGTLPPISRWTELHGLTLRGADPDDDPHGVEHNIASFYSGIHSEIRDAAVTFSHPRQNVIDLEFTGYADFHWNEDLDKAVPISITTTARFVGIRVATTEVAEADAWLSAHFAPEDLNRDEPCAEYSPNFPDRTPGMTLYAPKH